MEEVSDAKLNSIHLDIDFVDENTDGSQQIRNVL